jgi:hypothetical protein
MVLHRHAHRVTKLRRHHTFDRTAATLTLPPEGMQGVRISDELTARVARDAYVITHNADVVPANVLVVRMRGGAIVLCSSPYEREATHAMLLVT